MSTFYSMSGSSPPDSHEKELPVFTWSGVAGMVGLEVDRLRQQRFGPESKS